MFRVINIKTTNDNYWVKVPGNTFEDAVNQLADRMVDGNGKTSGLLFVEEVTNPRQPQMVALRWDLVESFRDEGVYVPETKRGK